MSLVGRECDLPDPAFCLVEAGDASAEEYVVELGLKVDEAEVFVVAGGDDEVSVEVEGEGVDVALELDDPLALAVLEIPDPERAVHGRADQVAHVGGELCVAHVVVVADETPRARLCVNRGYCWPRSTGR